MKMTFKKALCLLLSLIMLASAFTASVSALEIDLNRLSYEFTLSADGSGVILTKCTNAFILDENVVIPATYDKDNVRYSVVGIGALAFENCTSLVSVNIPRTLVSCESDAFNGCASGTANCYKANYMFSAAFALNQNVNVNVLDKNSSTDTDAQVNNILDIVMTFIRKILDIIKGIFSKVTG